LFLRRGKVHHQPLDAGAKTTGAPELFRSVEEDGREDDSALSNPVATEVKKDIDKFFYLFLSLLFRTNKYYQRSH
jgi:hypothetical protein